METMDMNSLAGRLVRQEDGQDLIEYSLLAALIAVGSVGVITGLRDEVLNFLGVILIAVLQAAAAG